MTASPDGDVAGSAEGVLCIDCDDCRMQHTDVCGDCVVTFVLSRDADDAVVLDVAEARAMRSLAAVGLVPMLRLDRRTG